MICLTYRPPSCPVSCFDELLKPSFTSVLTFNKPIIVLGDLNCKLLQNFPENKALGNFISELNLKQLITSPTRITDTCSSLIDVIMVSTPDLVHESGTMTHAISDHLPVYVVLKLKRPKPPPCYITVRSYKKYNSESFLIDLASKSDQILPIFTENDVNAKLSVFNDVFLSTLKKHAPVTTIKVRNRPCPYVTQEIKALMKERDQLHRKFQLSRDINDWQAYKDARNSVKNTLKNSEKNYVCNEVNTHKDDVGSLWKIINRIIPRKERPTHVYSKPTEQIANDFNEYFVSVGKLAANAAVQLAKDNHIDIPAVRNSPMFNGNTFNFSPVSCTEIQRIIKSMPSNKSPGPDKVNMRVIKDVLPVILGPLTDIINTSLTTSTFPDYWKEAEVIPLLKEGDHEHASNNRPLSLLKVASKICEKVAFNQFSLYLSQNNHLNPHQSGNKKHHSTESLNILVCDSLLNAMDNKKISALILLDLSKAFDSISHDILLRKLKCVGASEKSVKWFQSYLSGRTQRVRIGSSVSKALPITHGIPQGAILSPLLFSLYTNDLPSMVQVSKLDSFVDDSKMLLSFPIEHAVDAKHHLETDLNKVATWCCENELLINPEKTKFLLVGTRQLLTTLPLDMSLSFLKKTLLPVSYAKDLGVTFDRYLTFDKHVGDIVSSCMAKLCQINRVKHCFDCDTLIKIITTLVLSKLYYCSSIWCNTSTNNIKKLQAVQNFACRIITNTNKFDHITPALYKIGWLPVKEHLDYRDIIMSYKCMNGLAPPYLCELFNKRAQIHDRVTGNIELLHIPLCNTASGQRSFRFRAVRLWNNLDNELKQLPFDTFKKKIKANMFDHYFN